MVRLLFRAGGVVNPFRRDGLAMLDFFETGQSVADTGVQDRMSGPCPPWNRGAAACRRTGAHLGPTHERLTRRLGGSGLIGDVDRVDAALLLGWGTFALVWLLGAFTTARTVRRDSGWGRFLFAVLVLIGFLLARLLPGSVVVTARFVDQGDAWFTAGSLLLALGVALAIWARIHLGRLWSGRVTLKEGHKLIQSGPYAFVRNPIYTGILLAALGTAILTARTSLLALVAFLFIGFLLKIRQEERLLAGAFGPEFADYQRRVKRLVPWLW